MLPSDWFDIRYSMTLVNMTALQPRRMTDQVVRVLRDRIVTGELVAGARVEINDLCAELGVSHTPVREAILQLEALGLVTRQPYRGTVVTGIDPNQLEEITALRIDLEGRATLLGVPRLSDGDVERMRRIHLDIVSRAPDAEAFNRLNREFHGIVYDAADSPTLSRLITILQDEADRIRLHVEVKNDTAAAFHAEILAACARRDPPAACAVTRRHLWESFLAMRGGVQSLADGLLADVVAENRTELNHDR
ncbi:GntR family transcriptional regulator [Tersicoccus solisilvae]|uniref:GntR family transcriptional regulator n=2 Tax=Tersicoccus solisilvae TaxID=1882339 RepID=A0ABQ1NTZ2_9MICC|nr:GntR family transcriptional regulator [Tersicoccus solisilvae]